jgi:RNase P protein component
MEDAMALFKNLAPPRKGTSISRHTVTRDFARRMAKEEVKDVKEAACGGFADCVIANR